MRKHTILDSAALMQLHRDFIIKICAFFFMMLYSQSSAQMKSMNIDRVSLNEATVIALNNNPSIRLARTGYDVSTAGLRLSRSGLFPNINITAQGSRTEGAFVFNPDFPAREQSYSSYTTGLSVNQLIYDFGRTYTRISAGSSLVSASDLDVIAARENVVVNLQTAYFAYVQSIAVEKVNEESLRLAEEHLKIARAFFNAGRRPQYDVTKAEVDAANANVALLRSRNLVEISRLQLENAMGVSANAIFTPSDSLAILPFNITLDSARAIAFNNRAELKAQQFRLQANQALVTSAWAQNLPTIAAFGTYNWSGFRPGDLRGRWNAGVSLNFPIFQGFAVNAQVEQNQAQAEQVQANIEVLRQSIMLDVSQNYLSLHEAMNRIEATNVLIRSAQENLNLAVGRYNSGVGSATEITDAQLVLSNARITYIQGLYDYNVSLIRLKKAMGIIDSGQRQ